MTQNKKGFTIIEVVLVLAIAGLIFLMVFIALPALQRSQRNTQREDDLSRVLTAANDFQSNNNGKSPWDGGSTKENFVKRYIDDTCNTNVADGTQYDCSGDQFRDPDGENYAMYTAGSMKTVASLKHFKAAESDTAKKRVLGGSLKEGETAPSSDPTFDHTFYAVTYASCGDEGEAVQGTGNRQYAVFYVL